jgi:hypothetical protein
VKIVKVQGGLGNQLFCIAFAHSVALLTGEPVTLDVGGFPRDRYGHRFLLHALAERLGGLRVSSHPLLAGRVAGAVMRKAPLPGYVSEPSPPTDPGALHRLARGGWYFNGYWQAQAYMARPDLLRREVRAFLDGRGVAPERRGVVIHYRTYGDEIRPDRRGAPGPDYVSRALAAIAARGGPIDDVVLISDDPAVAMRRLGPIGHPITAVGAGDPDADMALMLRADALVLSNSSFSWWGGFCGDAETVIYPTRGDLFHYPTPAERFVCV